VENPGSLPGARVAALISETGWPWLFAGIAAIAYVFPDGRFFARRWRRIATGGGVALVGMSVLGLFRPGPFESPLENVRSPLPQLPSTPAVESLFGVFVLVMLAVFIAAAFAVRARMRSATGIARVQMLWFANAALLVPGALVICLLESAIVGGADEITFAAVCLAGIAVPLSIAAAILRHNLFDIELVLSRALVYGALTIGVLAIYFAIVAGIGTLIDSRSAAGLLAVGLAAVGIEPLRARVQRRVDRMIYGDRRTPYAALQRLTERLQGTLSPSQAVQTVVDSVAEAMRLPYVAIELDRAADAPEIAAAHGAPDRGEIVALPLTYQGSHVGRLVVQVPPGRELVPADESLLADLAGHAGVAVHNVRLTTDLQRSRERIVTAREEERRRLRRDLHDGLGPDLAAIALRLDAARSMAGPTPVGETLSELRDQTREAIGGVRRIVDELRPPALDELGLVSALGEHAARLSAPVAGDGGGLDVHVDGPDVPPPLPAAVEVAAYRIGLEAMTNAARHAHARRCDVRIHVDGDLRVEVSDDGDGLPRDAQPGVGLGSMRERAAEVGGTWTIAGRPGGGTTVCARLPLERA
jgi:two-component system NarL family sensor kinase